MHPTRFLKTPQTPVNNVTLKDAYLSQTPEKQPEMCQDRVKCVARHLKEMLTKQEAVTINVNVNRVERLRLTAR